MILFFRCLVPDSMLNLYKNRVDFMKDRGFTLVELIAVIVVLAILIVLVAPSLLDSSRGAREKTYQTKIVNIETAAVLYGQDNYRKIIDNANKGEDSAYGKESTEDIIFRTMTIQVKDLVPNYLSKDTFDDNPYFVQDPRDTSKYLDEKTVTIKINPNTRKVTAKYNE